MQKQSEDNKSVGSFLAGDDSAFEVLLKKYLKPVYNFLYQLTGDRAALDDLTQITFIKVWKNLHRFDTSKSFKVWIFTIARNTAYDYLKKKKTIPFSFFENDEGYNKLEEITDEKILPDEILERKNIAREFEKKLENIPSRYRVILLMRYKEDLSLSEIGKILGLPYNTVKSRHQRALQNLKNLLSGENASNSTGQSY